MKSRWVDRGKKELRLLLVQSCWAITSQASATDIQPATNLLPIKTSCCYLGNSGDSSIKKDERERGAKKKVLIASSECELRLRLLLMCHFGPEEAIRNAAGGCL